MLNKKYSVLMSVYYKERPEWLEYSIQSMIDQTVKPNEFVLVEDGPLTEELQKVINKFLKKYKSLFNIVKIDKNGGLGPALALGITKCKNELIARMDSDDYSVPDRCEKQLELFEKNENLDIVGSNIAEFVDDINNVQAHRILPESDEDIKKFARRRNPFGHPSIMFKKSKVLEAGNYRSYYLCEDYDMWIRMIEKGAICYNIKDFLVYMRINDDFYKRRGGIKYLKSLLKFKKEQLNKGFYSKKDFIISASSSLIVCLLPNGLRDFIYRRLLRK